MSSLIEFNPLKHFLGKLCKREHDWEGSGNSLRWLNRSSHTCVVCTRENFKKSYQADPEAVKKRVKEYRKTKVEFFKEYQKQYQREHKKQCCEYSLKYRLKNLDKEKARILRYREANRELILERNRDRDRKRYQTQERKEYCRWFQREYRRRFPESVKVMHNRRRTRLKKVHKSFYTAIELKSRLELFKDVCCYCGKKLDGKGTVDHFIPIASGGSDVLGNLVLCCQSCNSSATFAGRILFPQSWRANRIQMY